MLSPVMTVVVLAVLWLIVVVPDDLAPQRRAPPRAVASTGSAGRCARSAAGPASVRIVGPEPQPRTEVFVPQTARRPGTAAARSPPVPAAQEALMYPVDPPRCPRRAPQMMARRRRSLVILVGGTVRVRVLGCCPSAACCGGSPRRSGSAWSATCSSCARRRCMTASAASAGSSAPPPAVRHGFDATDRLARFEDAAESVVRIDDDDLELHNMDTIDLTGLYIEDGTTSGRCAVGCVTAPQRRSAPGRCTAPCGDCAGRCEAVELSRLGAGVRHRPAGG